MVKFDVKLASGEEQEVRMMDYLPARVGMKARSKLGVGLETDGKQADVKMENALEKADSALEYIVKEMLDRSDADIGIDDLSYESYQTIAQHYWKQVQGEEAKN